MAPEFRYDLPDGDHVWVIDPETAAANLAKLVRNYGEGFDEAMVVGDDRPLGVVIPFQHWLEYLDLYEAKEAEDRSAETVRRRIASARREDYVELDDFLERMRKPPEPNDGG